ncbi:hypothetical protein BJ138DRAFT_1182609 [Hygrophoropsis aurantiaca]|uniref:Uncharacterized protein n=1 Tax=Hygrophoropsis aurantiaca TaxID=72124 RepID=A0ACB8A190_9AGAM|nr:hypothetical protein BJ138DRAFT_1182609 [Hygrophoropsis aurantiaca]
MNALERKLQNFSSKPMASSKNVKMSTATAIPLPTPPTPFTLASAHWGGQEIQRRFSDGAKKGQKVAGKIRERQLRKFWIFPWECHEDPSEGANNGRIGKTLASSSMLPHFVSQPGQLPTSTPPSTHEYALVSQLLLKIQELEEINAQISELQAHTAAQLQSVQMGATSIRLVYERQVTCMGLGRYG